MLAPRLRKFEAKIVEMCEDIAKTKGTNEKEARIIGYFFIHRKLTQKQIHELTGFSMGTIIPILRYLVTMKFLFKEKIPGTHTNQYMVMGNINQFSAQLIIQFKLLGEQAIKFFKEMHTKISSTEIIQSKEFLLGRIKDIIQYFKEFLNVVNIAINKLIKEDITKTGQSELKLFSSPTEFSDIHEIERNIIDFFSKITLLQTSKYSFSKLLGILFTHESLTQKQLQTLTGFSAGTVSQDLKLMENMGLIIRSNTKSARIIYQLAPASTMLIKFTKDKTNTVLKWKPILEEMKQELDDNFNELGVLKGFDTIYTVISQIQRVFPIYEQLSNFLKNKQ